MIDVQQWKSWWGNKGDLGGINWMNWSSLRMNKAKGGIGLRNLRTFNLAFAC